MDELWNPSSVVLILTTIGLVIDKIITSYFTGKKLSMIEAHVNSQKTADASKIQALDNENRLLREQASENSRIAAVLAQSASARIREIEKKEDPKVLHDIKENTEATVEAVKDLKKGS